MTDNLTLDPQERSVALMTYLARLATKEGVAEHVYIVGGAVRNWLIGQPIKDIDVVIDSVALGGKGATWFSAVVHSSLPVHANVTTNQYGVAIVTIKGTWKCCGKILRGDTIEIATARKESYGGAEGKGYKPHMVEPATIEEDLVRREFTFNTLLWRLSDLTQGPSNAPVFDLTGKGRSDLEQRLLRTPMDPDKTFSDDPTRMLRAIKFVAKYGFRIEDETHASILDNADKLKQMPWDAVRKILIEDIFGAPNPRNSLRIAEALGLTDVLEEMLDEHPGFTAALGRSLTLEEHGAHLLLDLHALEWPMRSPVSFLKSHERERLREILVPDTDDLGWNREFVEKLTKPPVDQARLFEAYAIPVKERGTVVKLAREILLSRPLIAHNELEAQVEHLVRTKYGVSSPA